MSKYELKVPLNSINVETWKHILGELSDIRETSYIIDINESNTFSWYYNGDFIKAIKAVKKSSHYSTEDEYVLINLNTKSIVSGDKEYILDRLYMKKESYINTLLSYLNSGTIFYSYWMRDIIEEC